MTEFTAEVELVAVFVTVAVRTSDGPGLAPSACRLARLRRWWGNRRAVYGDQPPRGFSGGGAQAGDAGRMMPG